MEGLEQSFAESYLTHLKESNLNVYQSILEIAKVLKKKPNDIVYELILRTKDAFSEEQLSILMAKDPMLSPAYVFDLAKYMQRDKEAKKILGPLEKIYRFVPEDEKKSLCDNVARKIHRTMPDKMKKKYTAKAISYCILNLGITQFSFNVSYRDECELLRDIERVELTSDLEKAIKDRALGEILDKKARSPEEAWQTYKNLKDGSHGKY